MAKVSVWLTSYNHGSLLKKSIDSVLEQTYQDYELILIDDASTDGSQELIREYEKKDDRIRTILRTENVGHSAPYPYLDTLDGEYIAILHGDDYWHPEKLEKQVQVLDARPEVSACFTAVELVDENGGPDRVHRNPFIRKSLSGAELLRYFFDHGNGLCQSSSLMRVSAYRQFGIDLEGYNGLADYCKWLELALDSVLCIIPEELTFFRNYLSEGNMSGERPESTRRVLLEEYFLMKKFFSISDPELLLAVFPETEPYFRDGRCHIPFAVARMMLSSSKRQARLAGLEKLMELRRNKADREELEKRYHYDNKAFDRDKQRYDIFDSWPRERFLECGLYLNYGEGYGEENVLRKHVFIPSSGTVQIRFEIPQDGQRSLLSMRFDPDEHVLRRIRICSVQWEDKSDISYRSDNAEEQVSGWDVFYTADPQYILEGGQGHSAVCINLKAESISPEEVCSILEQLKKGMKKKAGGTGGEKSRLSHFWKSSKGK